MARAKHEKHYYGPPGTGKTTTISREIEHMTSGELALLPEEIIVSSFTVAAARELSSRLDTIPDDNVSTLHSFGYHQLGSPEVLGGKKPKGGRKDATDEWNQEMAQWGYAISRSEGASLDPDTAQVFDTPGDALLNQCNLYRSKLVPLEQWNINARAFWSKWKEFKNMHSVIDFTDMIELPLLDNMGPPFGARVGFFDEAQDFTPLMLARIRQMKADMDMVVLAGDDDQAIYGFTGVDPSVFIDADAEKRVLSQSYRLPRWILDYSQRWIEQVSHRQPKSFAPREDGEDGTVGRRDYTYGKPDTLAEEVEALAETGNSVMILVPNNYQTDPIVAELRSRGIPFHNPYRLRDGRWNPLGRPRDGQTSTVDRVLAFLKPEHTAGDVRRFMELMSTRGIFRNATAAKEELSKLPYNAPFEPLDYFHDGAYEYLKHGGLDFLLERVKPEKKRVVEYVKAISDTRGLEVLEEPPKVVIGTIHSVKGGEADYVFVLPALSKEQYGEYQRDKDPFIRQFYVAMTRAKKGLILCDYSGTGIDL